MSALAVLAAYLTGAAREAPVSKTANSPEQNLITELRAIIEQTDSLARRVCTDEAKDAIVLGYAALRNRLAVPR